MELNEIVEDIELNKEIISDYIKVIEAEDWVGSDLEVYETHQLLLEDTVKICNNLYKQYSKEGPLQAMDDLLLLVRGGFETHQKRVNEYVETSSFNKIKSDVKSKAKSTEVDRRKVMLAQAEMRKDVITLRKNLYGLKLSEQLAGDGLKIQAVGLENRRFSLAMADIIESQNPHVKEHVENNLRK